MALVERLMKVGDDGNPIHDRSDAISCHTFFAALNEIVAGALTLQNVKDAFTIRTVADSSGRSDADDINALAAAAPPASSPAGRALYIERLHAVFLLAEVRFVGYETPPKIRAKLGI